MEISFKDKKLENIVNNDRKLVEKFGKERANKIRARLSQLRSATNLEEVRNLPGHYHELTKNRKGQWACDLDQPYRLIFMPHETPIPSNNQGQYVWEEILGVEVIEIIDYH